MFLIMNSITQSQSDCVRNRVNKKRTMKGILHVLRAEGTCDIGSLHDVDDVKDRHVKGTFTKGPEHISTPCVLAIDDKGRKCNGGIFIFCQLI